MVIDCDRSLEASRLDTDVVPVDLRPRSDHPLAIVGTSSPRLAWRLDARRDAVRQEGYEVEVADRPDFDDAASSGFVASTTPFDAPWPAAALRSRDVRWCRVRVWTDRGRTEWSTPLRIEAALLDRSDWRARPISPISNANQPHPVPVPLLRRGFRLDQEVISARLYVSALGIHATSINGLAISGDLLESGWPAYGGRNLYAAYDVAHLLRTGDNVIAAAVGDGWWRGELTWMEHRAVYGDTTALIAQLEIELAGGEHLMIATDDSWRGSTGGLVSADLYHGATLDLRREPAGWRDPGFDDSGWEPALSLVLPARMDLREMPAARVVECLEVEPVRTDRGTLLIDCGQNLTGWLRLKAKGPEGAAITVRHAEVLDGNGLLHTAALRNARATDTYILDHQGSFVLEPEFTFHGFRFAEIETDECVSIDQVEALVISSDVEPAGNFECSDPLVTRLWENVRWSQRGNFLVIPTDCPQRDERLGWTGDIQVFAQTACMNSNVRAFLASWLEDLALEQRDDGCVPVIVPNVMRGHEFEYGSVGWGDAATLVPWALYEAYGDREVLRRQYDSMVAWVGWCASRLGPDGVWQGDFQLGDWLDPGAPPSEPFKARTSGDFIATSYLAHSAATLAKTAGLLGRTSEAAHYAGLSAATAQAAWSKWRDHALTTQTGCAMAIEFGIAPREELPVLGDRLAALVNAGEGRIGTGFLGTPLILPALTRTGQVEAAYRLLLNRRSPGWLHQVLHGATTIWERWDAIREDGSIHPGEMSVGEGSSMMSFNHYAYGAVAAWLYRTLAGIAPDEEYPGYEMIRFAPRPGGGISHARAALRTPFGHAAIRWELSPDAGMTVECTVPAGAQARFIPPAGFEYRDPQGEQMEALIGSGQHRFVLSKQPA